ncbi:unnamed protein product [Paramecium octaurelia]|uniref:Uncharacterized protein n=1 Tax=Paramecium octaurelia TaxID=43137 RepID=A0A8S1WEE8_PAROT|nr:unnamed protein product [Paramecium octaurelia]
MKVPSRQYSSIQIWILLKRKMLLYMQHQQGPTSENSISSSDYKNCIYEKILKRVKCRQQEEKE